MTMSVIIVGGGRVGRHLTSLLLAGGHRVKLIESRGDIARRLQAEMGEAVVVAGNGSDPTLLETAGVRGADVVAAVAGVDATNLVVCSLARFEFSVPRTIARINDPENAWLFTPAMGVDVALNQSDLMGHLVAEEMSLGDMMTLLKLRKGQYSLVEEKVHPEAAAAGKAIRDLPFPRSCTVVAVIRKGELIVPRGDTVLQAVDEVLALVHSAQLDQFSALLGRPS